MSSSSTPAAPHTGRGPSRGPPGLCCPPAFASSEPGCSPCPGLSWGSGHRPTPHSAAHLQGTVATGGEAPSHSSGRAGGGRGCLARAEPPQSPSCRLPFAPAIRAPASTLPACANTETHLNKLRRHNKSKGNEGLCLGAGESLEFNYIGKPLATKARQVPRVASADVWEQAQLRGGAGSAAPRPMPGSAPAPPPRESEGLACGGGSRALPAPGLPAAGARADRLCPGKGPLAAPCPAEELLGQPAGPCLPHGATEPGQGSGRSSSTSSTPPLPHKIYSLTPVV